MGRGGYPRMNNGGQMQNVLRQAQKMQEEMAKAQEELEAKEFETSVGGGAVTVTMNGKKEVISIKISPEAVDPDDVEILEDMLVAAVNEGIRKVEEASASQMGKITGGLNIPGLF